VFGSTPRKPGPSHEPLEVREAVSRLDKLSDQRPELAEPIRLVRELLPILFDSGDLVALPANSLVDAAREAGEKLARGEPLWRGVPLGALDRSLAARWDRVCSILGHERGDESPRRLAEVVRSGELSLANSLEEVLAAGPAQFRRRLDERGLDADLGSSALRLTALPVLAPWADAMQATWQRVGWPRGNCPACGSWPLLAEFRGLEQFHWLRCGLCSAGWQVDRLVCPFCESRDHRQLHDLSVEGQEQRFRVAVCDECGGFVRSISTLAPLSPPMLLVTELETLHLEVVAHSRGYGGPTSRS